MFSEADLLHSYATLGEPVTPAAGAAFHGLFDAADLDPVHHNAPDNWAFTGLDKGGFTGAPISEEEARVRQEAETRASMEEFIAACGGVKGERTAAVTAGLSCAT